MNELLPKILKPLETMKPHLLNANDQGLNLVREIPFFPVFLGRNMPGMLKQGTFVRFDPDSEKRDWDHSREELLLMPQTSPREKWVVGVQKSVRTNDLSNGYRHSYTLYLVSAIKPQHACQPARFIEKVRSKSIRISLAHFEKNVESFRLKQAHIDNTPFSPTVKRFMDAIMRIDGHGHKYP